MAATVYEGMFILDPNRYGRDPDKVVGAIPRLVEQAGGEMLVSRLWDERRLAYPIKGHVKGTYWLTYFRVDSGRMAEIRRKCEINEDFLRVLFLKIDPRIVDAVVAHARCGAPPKSAESSGAGQDEPLAEDRSKARAASRRGSPPPPDLDDDDTEDADDEE